MKGLIIGIIIGIILTLSMLAFFFFFHPEAYVVGECIKEAIWR